jgi:Cu+-exporting ATPase
MRGLGCHAPSHYATLDAMNSDHFDPRRPPQEVTLHVKGLHCTNCALSIEKHLTKVGVENPAVDYASGRTSFLLREPEKLPEIVQSIQRLGYSVSDTDSPTTHGRDVTLYVQTIISALLTIPLFVGMFFSIHWLHDPFHQCILMTPVFIIGIMHFGASGIRSLRSGVANMDVLISAGILAGYIASVLTLIYGLSQDLIFFEAVGSIVTFVLVGHLLEELAVKKTTSAIEDLSRLQPQEVTRVAYGNDGRESTERIPLRDLRVDDLVQVNTGDRAPSDGVIEKGAGSFDESMITGEAIPVDHTQGERVIGGTVLQSGSVIMRVSAVGDDTTLASIIRLVREAQQRKPSIQRIGDAVSAVFVPAVLVIALLVLAGGLLFFDLTPAQAIIRGLAIVVVACPCAMGLATPSAIMVSLGRAARNGILIRGGDTLERLGKVKHVAFDKTGTLTTGQLQIGELHILDGFERQKAVAIMVALQRTSSHPIAQAIVNTYQKEAVEPFTFSSTVETKGVGVSGVGSDGATYAAGGQTLASRLGINLREDLILTRDGVMIASCSLSDSVRPEASTIVSHIHALGCSTSIISGDTQQKCDTVARAVGIETTHAQQLPEQKLEILRSIQSRMPAAFVGDGINDAPTLTEASVGISLSSASDIAMNSSQVLLTGGTIAALPAAIRLSRLTVSTIKQNLFWALIYNVLAVPLAASGLISPLTGALLMTMSDLVIVGNSLRIKFRSIS